MAFVRRTSNRVILPTSTLPIGRNAARPPNPPLVYPFRVLVKAAVKGAATGADEIWTVGETAGEEESVPKSASCQSLTTYLTAELLCVTVGAQIALMPTRWRMSSAELPFSCR